MASPPEAGCARVREGRAAPHEGGAHRGALRQAERRRSSYVGEITPAVDNLVAGVFRAEGPNRLWLTDVSEFAAADGKVYLSPVIDCYDGMVVSWSTARHPDSGLVSRMLEGAVATLDAAEHRGAEAGRRTRGPRDPYGPWRPLQGRRLDLAAGRPRHHPLDVKEGQQRRQQRRLRGLLRTDEDGDVPRDQMEQSQ